MKKNKLTLFLILTFVMSFSSAGIYALMGGGPSGKIEFTVLGIIYMFIPTIAVLIVQKYIHHEKIKTDLLVSFKINKWFFIAWFLMPIISLCSIGISLLFPGVLYNPEMLGMIQRFAYLMTPEQLEHTKTAIQSLPINLLWITLIQGLIAGATINALAAFGEELGWRGFLLKEFKNMSFIKASIIIGFIWGIWHAPLILMGHNYPQHPQIGVLMMIVLCILLTPLLLYVTIKSKSVIAAAIMHGTMNATAGVSIMAVSGGSDLTVGIAGLSGFITLVIFIGVLFVYDYYIGKDRIFLNKINKYL